MRFRQAGNVSIADERTIVEYCLISSYDEVGLEADVVRMVGEGWQPFGSLAIAHCEAHMILIQPMVMYEEDSKPTTEG